MSNDNSPIQRTGALRVSIGRDVISAEDAKLYLSFADKVFQDAIMAQMKAALDGKESVPQRSVYRRTGILR